MTRYAFYGYTIHVYLDSINYDDFYECFSPNFFLSTYFGESHQKYADTLLDYGFFLLNVDDIVRSVHAYTVCNI